MPANLAIKATLTACLCAGLSACGEAEEQSRPAERDPAVVQALNDQLMVDPDLAGQNEANAALTTGIDHSLPPFSPSRDTIRQARAEAVEMVGGEAKLVVPLSLAQADTGSGKLPPLESHISSLPGAEDCATSLRYSARWAARLPERLPVFPHGATIDAAGSTQDGCKLRAVTFLSGNTPENVAAFYAARAKGFELDYRVRGPVTQLTGASKDGRFALELRELPGGNLQASLLTFGL